MKKRHIFYILAIISAITGFYIINNQEHSIDDNSISLSGGRWPTRIITYTISPNTEAPIANAWVNAANEINRYNIVDFVISYNGSVTLGQQITDNETELGVTRNWRIGNYYSRSIASLTANQSLKKQEGANYIQRQYATALHEFGHILGLNHDGNPANIMYFASRRDVYHLDRQYLSAITQIYGIQSGGIKVPASTVNVRGTVKVDYNGSINLWKQLGTNWTGRRLAKGTRWVFFKITNYNGRNWYNLGGNQWVDANYVKQV